MFGQTVAVDNRTKGHRTEGVKLIDSVLAVVRKEAVLRRAQGLPDVALRGEEAPARVWAPFSPPRCVF